MKLLELLSKKNTQETTEHRINPVYDTAKDCLINLVRSGCDEAALLNRELGFTENDEASTAIHKGSALFQESRYRFVNEEIKKTGIKNVMDIGCGYSPRGILLSGQGYCYLGADLPATIKEMKPAVTRCVGDGCSVGYVPVDATNPGSLMEAAEQLEGPVCIVSEGLFMYLPPYELNEYIKGVQGILEAHGGCIITPDFCMNRLFKTAISATGSRMLGSVLQKLAGAIVKEYTVASKDKMDPAFWYSKESDDEPYRYFTSKGFKIERVPVYSPDVKLRALDFVRESKRHQLEQEYREIFAWKLTV